MVTVAVLSLATPASGAAGSAKDTAQATEYVATFAVPHSNAGLEEKFNVRLTSGDDIKMAQDILAKRAPQRIPAGELIRGFSDVNSSYSWSIDPDTFTFAAYALKICDVMPSFVDTDGYRNVESYCPWHGRLIGLTPIASLS
ncbi:hypothetical protein [Catellatospora sp. NPDC049609]|uniref:BP74-related protein n=1 Tax=Catellatospora sp. NPDC049609 TaxID=3155505 RepID=UPI00342E3FC0